MNLVLEKISEGDKKRKKMLLKKICYCYEKKTQRFSTNVIYVVLDDRPWCCQKIRSDFSVFPSNECWLFSAERGDKRSSQQWYWTLWNLSRKLSVLRICRLGDGMSWWDQPHAHSPQIMPAWRLGFTPGFTPGRGAGARFLGFTRIHW